MSTWARGSSGQRLGGQPHHPRLTVRGGAAHLSWGSSTGVLLRSQFSEPLLKKRTLWWAPAASRRQDNPYARIKILGTAAAPRAGPHWSPQASSGDVFRIMITVI